MWLTMVWGRDVKVYWVVVLSYVYGRGCISNM